MKLKLQYFVSTFGLINFLLTYSSNQLDDNGKFDRSIINFSGHMFEVSTYCIYLTINIFLIPLNSAGPDGMPNSCINTYSYSCFEPLFKSGD